MTKDDVTGIDDRAAAAAFRRLLAHLRHRSDAQYAMAASPPGATQSQYHLSSRREDAVLMCACASGAHRRHHS